jgi:hypothetical protein
VLGGKDKKGTESEGWVERVMSGQMNKGEERR